MRKMTWFILIVNVLFVVWIVSGLASLEGCDGLSGAELDACEAGEAIGATMGVGIIIFLWALVDVILGVIWLVTNRRQRDCPVCGAAVKKGQTTCKKCGHDFKAAAMGASVS